MSKVTDMYVSQEQSLKYDGSRGESCIQCVLQLMSQGSFRPLILETRDSTNMLHRLEKSPCAY